METLFFWVWIRVFLMILSMAFGDWVWFFLPW